MHHSKQHLELGLSDKDRSKLCAVLDRALDERCPDGERLAAGGVASRLLKSRGLSISDIIISPAGELQPRPQTTSDDYDFAARRRPRRKQRAESRQPDDSWPWRCKVAFCLQRPHLLTEWERTRFLTSLRTFPRLSEKQEAALEGIFDRVQAAEAAEAGCT